MITLIYYLLSLVLGILTKIYDEITDETIRVSLLNIEIIKYFIIGIATIVSSYDVGFLFMILAMMLGSLLVDTNIFNIVACNDKNIAFNDNFWYATIIYFSALGVLLSLLNYKHFKLSFQNGLVFIAMIGFFLLTLIEPQFFPEENPTGQSLYVKIFFRLFCFICCILYLVICNCSLFQQFKIFQLLKSQTLEFIYMFGIGYAVASLYNLCFNKNKQEKREKLEKLEKREKREKREKNKKKRKAKND